MEHVINSTIRHHQLSPLGWESQPRLNQPAIHPWTEISAGLWRADSAHSRRFVVTIPGEPTSFDIEYCATYSMIRAYCGSISMQIKKESAAFQNIDQANMTMSRVFNQIIVTAYIMDERGVIQSDTDIYSDDPLSGNIDWTNVNFMFGGPQKRIITIENVIASHTINMPAGQEWNDLSGEKAYVKDITTAPLSMSLFEQQIGSKENAIEAPPTLFLNAGNPTWFTGRWNTISRKLLSLAGHNPLTGVTRTRLKPPRISLTSKNPAYVWNVPLNILSGAKIVYTMTITGDPDIDIPISSFQSIVRQGGSTKAERDAAAADHAQALIDLEARRAEGLYDNNQAGYDATLAALQSDYEAQLASLEKQRPSYLSCVVPNSIKYVDDISTRLDGLIIIKKGYEMPDGSRNLEEITRANFDHLAFSRGAHNDSAIITGYKTKTYSSPKTRTVTGVSFIALEATGRRRIRATVDLFLKPKDTCVYGTGETEKFTVGQIMYSVGERSAIMEVTEADETF